MNRISGMVPTRVFIEICQIFGYSISINGGQITTERRKRSWIKEIKIPCEAASQHREQKNI